MRRKDREIKDTDELLAVIGKCKVCRLGLAEYTESIQPAGAMPYVVPMNFGFTWEENILTLYFHSAREGKKIDIIGKNNNACFEMDCDHALKISGERACDTGFAFTSVIGFGRIEFVNTIEEKSFALNMLMRHQTGRNIQHNFTEKELHSVTIFKMIVDTFSGKRNLPMKQD